MANLIDLENHIKYINLQFNSHQSEINVLLLTVELPIHNETLNLFKRGFTITKIAQMRELRESTIESHIATLIEEGKILDEDIDLSTEKRNKIKEAITSLNGDTSKLKPIKELCSDDISYGDIKFYLALLKA